MGKREEGRGKRGDGGCGMRGRRHVVASFSLTPNPFPPLPPSRFPLPRFSLIDADTFRPVLGRFASGVTIVPARDRAGTAHGMTVSAFSSLSLEPSLVLFCVDHAASLHALLLGHPRFGISILSSGQEAY